MEKERREQEQERKLTWQQVRLIAAYEAMGRALSDDLADDPPLRDELSDLLHNGQLTYEEVLRNYFFESGRDLATLVDSPFVRAFASVPYCTEEELAFLDETRSLAVRAQSPPEAAMSDFRGWVETRIPFMVKGLQRCILDSGVVPPLAQEEIARRSAQRLRERIKTSPDEFARYQRIATEAAAKAAQPRVFTDEVKAKMQGWFDRGLDYLTVSELLGGIGIEITPESLRKVMHSYNDLHYTLGEIRKRQRQGFLEAARAVFELSGSRQKTKEILERLGHSRAKTHAALHELGLRVKVDWTETVEIEGETKKLEDLVRPFLRGNYPTVKDEYQAFVSYLREKGVEKDISLVSYKGKRKILGQH